MYPPASKHSFSLNYRNVLSQSVKQILHHSIFITIIELENAFKANESFNFGILNYLNYTCNKMRSRFQIKLRAVAVFCIIILSLLFRLVF